MRSSTRPLVRVRLWRQGLEHSVVLFGHDCLLENDSLVSSLILFFGSYFDAPYEGKDLETFFRKAARTNLSTLRSDLEEISQTILDRRTGKKVTISNEIVRSLEEAEIANFLYLHQIDYEYEPLYKYNIPGARKGRSAA